MIPLFALNVIGVLISELASEFESHICTTVLAELFPVPYLCEKTIRYSNRLHEISIAILRCCVLLRLLCY